MKASELKKIGISRDITKVLISKGFINPKKDSSGDYDYSDEEVRYLKRYKVLRVADILQSQLKSIENGDLSLMEALIDREKDLSSHLEKTEGSLEMCRLLIQHGVDYEALLKDEYYFNEYVKRIQEGKQFVCDDEMPDLTPIDLTVSVYCPHCGRNNNIDMSDYLYGETSTERPMGPDILYEFDTEDIYECVSCGKNIRVKGYISEYPVGAYEHSEIEVSTKL